MNNHVIDVALGNAAADMVIKNGRLLNVHTGEIYETEIAIADKVIAAVGSLGEKTVGENTKVIDAAGKIMVPGFIDAYGCKARYNCRCDRPYGNSHRCRRGRNQCGS